MTDAALDLVPDLTAQSARDIVAALGYPTDWLWAEANYKPTITALSRKHKLRRHLEIGAGRLPLYTPQETAALGFDTTLSDISARELSFAPDDYRKLTCDIASPDALAILGRDAYDMAYCRMVMEHVPDVPAMWRNIGAALAPGGCAVVLYPTLFAPPFVLNKLLPEKISRFLLETVFPHRKDDGKHPKFPAHYDHCFSSEEKIAPMLRAAGFSNFVILPFWGYSYFWKIPGLKQIDAAFTRLAERKQWRLVSSFAYIIAIK